MEPLELYLKDLREIRATGAGVPEESYYGALESLLNAVGSTLDPKVRAVPQVADTGAGHPDYGFYTADQYQSFSETGPLEGQLPERGVVEVKAVGDDAWLTADGEQVTRYWGRYGLVLVTNFRDFLLVGRNAEGQQRKLEAYHLAENEAAFWELAAHPRSAARAQGERFAGFLKRVLLHEALLSRPEDVAWFLASYAREALARMEGARGATLDLLRKALGDALDMKFEGEQGEHFFRSSLIQTLFYGIFSAWVIWNRHHPPAHDAPPFDWMHAASYLRVPIVRKLFHEIAEPGQLRELGLIQALDWAGMALNRVNRADFFARFEQEEAVQYFYEPFLEAYDPDLRKQLGVWYTPREVILYMVERVDRVLREELDIEDGLADSRVYVLDPCCGTGGYLVAVLDRIARTLQEKGEDALHANDIKQAAKERVFGFEILPAPYVVAHMQLGLRLEELGVPLAADERPGIYLTNALTGWEPPKGPKAKLLWPEMEREREAADKVKREVPILVILGNPPYNGYAGVAVAEERDLSDAYRKTKVAPKPQGQGLNDVYVRFFRMAERRIVEKTGRGVVCFISNYSWLDGLSFTGMRERYLEAFDGICIDCLNGDKYKTGKTTPWGEPDPSIFSTEVNREGIQVGTAIALLVRQRHEHVAVASPATGRPSVSFRHFWGRSKRADLVQALEDATGAVHQELAPPLAIGCPFMPVQVGEQYLSWPKLPDLLPVSFPGVKTSRDQFLVDIDRERLVARLRDYFDASLSDEEVARRHPSVMQERARYDPHAVRRYLLNRGFLAQNVVRYCYRPFDIRWLYWEPDSGLVDRPRPEYFPHVQQGNVWIEARQRQAKEAFDRGLPVTTLADNFGSGLSSFFPLLSIGEGETGPMFGMDPNLSDEAKAYLRRVAGEAGAAEAQLLFYSILATLHSPDYRAENAGGLRQDWPRIPLPNSAQLLEASAELGRRLAALLDPEQQVSGVTSPGIRPELRSIGNITHVEGRQLNPAAGDLLVTAGWGYPGAANATMPGAGKVVERDYADDEAETPRELGETTPDVYLNDDVYWSNIPQRVWDYHIGGYQVIKKWLSYRDNRVLGRSLKAEEARYVTEMARRIAAILMMEPELDANYNAVKENTYPWPGGSPQ